MDHAQSRLAQAINRYLEYFGWTPYQASQEMEIDRSVMTKMLTQPDYRPTKGVRDKIVKGFKLRTYEDIWQDPRDRAGPQEHAPPDDCIDLEQALDHPQTRIRGKPLSPLQREMLKYIAGIRPDMPDVDDFK